MSVFIKLYRPGNNCVNLRWWRFNSSVAEIKPDGAEEEFRVLDLTKKTQRFQKRFAKRPEMQPDRAERMAPEQNWGNVWPGPRSFHPSSVPLPMRQGYVPKGQVTPGRKANAELMKVPNFLHLTPPAIKTQCEAIKKFCTPWPHLLNSEEAIEKHYPLEIITSDYCHASPSIRNPLARIVNLRIKVSHLKLDYHAKDKFLRLVGDRYDPQTDLVTITADNCPIRKQNLDYVNYLLTACFHESWNVEDWESEKSLADMEHYEFETNPSKKNLVEWYLRSINDFKDLTDEEMKDFDTKSIPNGEDYGKRVASIMNDGENEGNIREYAVSTRKLLGLPDKRIVG